METTLNLIPAIYAKFLVYILAFTRISTMLYAFVVFRREMITGRVIIALSAVLAIYVTLLTQAPAVNENVFSLQMLGQELTQVLIGFIAGMILNLVIEVFVVLGQIVSTQVGLSLASLIDPRFGTITNLTQFYVIAATLMFLLLNGHLFIVELIMNSFTTIPIFHVFLPQTLMSDAMSYSGVMFSGGIVLSLTIIIAMMLTNIALAVMTKFAPQMNIFSIGINVALIFGLFCVYMTFNLFVDQGNNILRHGLDFLQQSFLRVK